MDDSRGLSKQWLSDSGVLGAPLRKKALDALNQHTTTLAACVVSHLTQS